MLRLLALSTIAALAVSASAHAQSVEGGVFLTPRPLHEVAFNRTSVAVDAAGGLHAAFQLTAHADAKPVYYGYCAPGADCADASAWSYLRLLDADLPFLELELTADGRPRLLLYNDSVIDENSRFRTHYVYAECDRACTTPTGWSVADLGASEDSGGLYTHRRYNARRFALDPQGRPRFVYQYGIEWIGDFESVRTNYLLACDEDCGDAGQWRSIALPTDYYFYDDLEESSLAYAPDGRVLLVTLLDGADGQRWLAYLECSASCAGAADWSTPILVLPMGANPTSRSWSLAVDALGRPRVAAQSVGLPMAYAWCEGDCTAPGTWGSYTLWFSDEEEAHPALALDAAGRPRLAFQQGTDLAYAWCESGCQTPAPQWAGGVVETASDLNRLAPTPVPGGCESGTWIGGYRPRLALRPSGAPVIGYDAEYLLRCYRTPERPNPGDTAVREWWWASRLVLVQQPGDPTTGRESETPTALAGPVLDAVYPNPARDAVSIRFDLPSAAPLRATIHDVLGREVARLQDGMQPAGAHTISWNGESLPSGTYIVRLATPTGVATERLTLVR